MTPSKTAMWTAVLERNQAFDGKFVYAVKTTAIFCRPSCPSRRPKPENVEFFDTPEAAREAGFRACSRCLPEQERSKRQMIVQQVREYIEQHFDEPITLDVLSDATGLSPEMASVRWAEIS